ncbi:MAG: hypothetical protein ACYCQI_03685 [Gammaproteobacteria bacterium]
MILKAKYKKKINDVAGLVAKVADLEAKLEQTRQLFRLKVAANQLIRELTQRKGSSHWNSDYHKEVDYYISLIEMIEDMQEHESISYITFYVMKKFHEESRAESWLPIDQVLKKCAEKIIAIENERNPSRIAEYEKQFALDIEKVKQKKAERARCEIAEREAKEQRWLAQEAEMKKQYEAKVKKKSLWGCS